MFSKNIKGLKTSPVRGLSKFVKPRVEEGIDVIHLNIGQPDLETPKEFIEAIRNFDEKIISYSASEGREELREAISDYYKTFNREYNKDEILITAGGSEALLFTLITLFNEGEELLIPEPYYANYNSFFSILGIKVVGIPTLFENNFKLPSKEVIKSLITDKTRAIMFSNPGNPTGAVYSKEELQILNEISKENDLFIISDEVYREFIYNENISNEEIFTNLDKVIVIDSISKRFSACGGRVGTILSKNKEFMGYILKLCQSRLSISTLDMVGAEALYKKITKDYYKTVNEIYKRRRDVLFEGLRKIEGVKINKPTGAFYSLVELPVDSSDDFSKWLIEKFSYNGQTVLLTPARGFYQNEELGLKQVRISYSVNEDRLEQAIEIIKRGLEEYNKR